MHISYLASEFIIIISIIIVRIIIIIIKRVLMIKNIKREMEDLKKTCVYYQITVTNFHYILDIIM